MEFIKKMELFFIQLQYCIAIEPEPVLQGENGIYSLLLKPDIFFKLVNDFQIEYPFIPENKIIELKGLMNKEGFKTSDAMKIIENFKKQYWDFDSVTMFQPVIEKLKRTLKSINSNISEEEINIELINFQKYLKSKRENIYIDLINQIKDLPPQPQQLNLNLSKIMKVNEYIPLYGLLHNFEYFTGIDGKHITVNDLIEQYPNFELTDIHIDQLYYFDLSSLQKVLKDNYFTTETVIPYIRELFDNYKTSGGDPFYWLSSLLESINLNPQNYKVELRSVIEKSLIEWIDIYSKINNVAHQRTETNKLKVPQIALIHVYEGIQITEENAKEIAANYGWTAKTSGKGLYHDYLKYCKTADRKAKPTAETKKTLINKIELFKSVVNYLTDKAKQKANDEINILNTILKNEYR